MADKQIASLFGAVGFKIDDRGLMQFHQRMQKTSQQMTALGKLADGIAAKLTKITGKSASAGGLNTSQLAKDVARLEILLAKVSQAKARAQTAFNREALSAGKLVYAGKQSEAKLQLGQLNIEKQRLGIEQLRQRGATSAAADEIKLQQARRRLAESTAINEQRQRNLALTGQQKILRVQREGTALQQAQFRLETMQARELERRARRTPSEAFSRPRLGMGSSSGASFNLGPVGGLGAFALGLGFATSALGSFAGALNDTINKLVGQQYATNAAAGGGAAGAAANQWLDSYSDSRGLRRADVADQYTSFLASGQGAGLENAVTQKAFAGFGDLATTLHLTGERQGGMFRAVAQMLSKGTVQSEELTGQLGEHLPGAVALFAAANAQVKKTGLEGQKAIVQLRKDMKAGLVGNDVVLAAANLAAQRAAPTLEASSQTSQAMQNRAANRKDKAILALGGAGISDANAAFFKRLDVLWDTVQDKAPALAKVYANLSVLAQNALTNLQSILLSSDNSGLMAALTEISYTLAEMSSAATVFFQIFSGKRSGALEALEEFMPHKDAEEFLATIDRLGTAWKSLVQSLSTVLPEGGLLPGLKDMIATTAKELEGLATLVTKVIGFVNTLIERREANKRSLEDNQWAEYSNGNKANLPESKLTEYNRYRARQTDENKPILDRDAWGQQTLMNTNLGKTTGLVPLPSLDALPQPEWMKEGLSTLLRKSQERPLMPTGATVPPNAPATSNAPISLTLNLEVQNAVGMDENALARQLQLTLPAAVQDGLRDALGSMQARQSENE